MRVWVLAMLAAWAMAAWLPANEARLKTPDPIAAPVMSASGERLANPRIISFDGLKFEVEHDAGIATLAWQRMPEEVRKRYPLDPAKAEVVEQKAAERRERNAASAAAREEAARELEEQKAAEATPTPPEPKAPRIVRVDIRLRELYIMSTIGGPPGELKITNITQTEVSFSRYKFGSETRELTMAFGEPRTLLFTVNGCNVYYVKTWDRERYYATVEFEYPE